MFKLLLLVGAFLAPAFSFSNEDRGGYEADIFRVPSPELSKAATLVRLIDEEPEALRRTTSSLQHPQGSGLAMTTLQYGSGEAAIAYLYRKVSGAERGDYICRIEIDPKSTVGLLRTMNWCLSFIDPAYRPFVVISPTEPL